MHKHKTHNIARLLGPYAGKWVAIDHSEKKVLAHGATLDFVLEKAYKKGEQHPIVLRAPDRHAILVL